MKKIIICGGHLTPALAIIPELQKRNLEIVYIGRKNALEGDKTISAEFKIITSLNYKFLPITAGRIQRKFTKFTFVSILKIPLGFIQAFYYLIKEKPQIVLSFGGYVAVPIVLSAWILRIPIITHEQTLVVGLANKFINIFADKILISWKESLNKFPKNKVIYTGVPIRSDIFTIKKKINIPEDKPVLYITGGNLGAHSLNIAVEKNLEQLLHKYTVIHQCGETEKYRDYEKLLELKRKLPLFLQKYYQLFKYINNDYIGYVMQKADFFLSRSGANIITEIIRLQKPSLLFPLPWSGNNEQYVNAQFLEINHAARILLQDQNTAEILINELVQLNKEKKEITENLQKLNQTLIKNPEKLIVDAVESLL